MIAPYLISNVLPTEAVQLNGEYLENQIIGYKTLYTKGRESLATTIESYQVGSSDGDNIKYASYPSRTITVGFVLGAESASGLRAKFNQLNGILKNEEAQFIFKDESDKFFVGVPIMDAEIEDRMTTVTGTWKIFCADPFKYSITEHEVTATDGTFTVNYGGTYPSRPKLEATIADGTEAGYVALIDSNEHIIQLGDPEESDLVQFPPSQVLINHNSSQINSAWTTNGGTPTYSDKTYVGSWKLQAIGSTTYITPSSYGTASTAWSGPSKRIVIPADSNGDVGAENFTFSFSIVDAISTASTAQKEMQQFQALIYSGATLIAGIAVSKTAVGSKGRVRFYYKGGSQDVEIDLSRYNRNYGYSRKLSNGKWSTVNRTTYITKSGDKLTINTAGVTKTFIVPETSTMKAESIVFTCQKKKTNPVVVTFIQNAKFIKNNCTEYKDVPNKFTAGDTITADCSDASIMLNEAPRPDLGALGNDWEEFCLHPGQNQIHVAYSDFTTTAPTCKLKYREVFI